MKNYSVVLMRPDYIADDVPYGQDCYVAFVRANNPLHARSVGQLEVFNIDAKDELEPSCAEDYHPLLVLEGHVDIALYGFQL